jgi:hypothetical protein
MRRFVFVFFSTCVLHGLSFVPQAMGQPKPPLPDVVLEGTVRDLAGQRGLSGLTMRLTPPNSVGSPVRIVRTDERGNFRFSDRNNSYHGKYLLEIYRGADLLFRKEIDTQLPRDRRILVRVRPVH